MRRLLSFSFIIFLACAQMWSQSIDKSFVFVDDQGREISDGTTLICNKLENYFEDLYLINSNLSIKQSSNTSSKYLRLHSSITRIDNGNFQFCFPNSTVSQIDVGDYVTDGGALMMNPQPILSEWLTDEDGTCIVDLRIEVLNKTNSYPPSYAHKAWGPSVTIEFVRGTVKDIYCVDGIYYIITGENTVAVTYRNKNYNSYKGDIVLPNNVEICGKRYTVTAITDKAFSECVDLTCVTIPNSVTEIGEGAFQNCINLAKIAISGSITSIKDYTFFGCNTLKEITIPNSVISIGIYAFYGCQALLGLNIPNNVTSIHSTAFIGCYALESLNYNAICCADFNPDGNPFNRLNIRTIEIGEGVKRIPAHFVSGLAKLSTIIFPNSVTTIGESAFAGCNGLTKVSISDLAVWCNIDFFDRQANPLSYAHHLYLDGAEVTNLNIPNTVTSISNYAFNGCSGLTGTLSIPQSITSIGKNAFNGCSGLTGTLSMPQSITYIGENAFNGCSGLTGTLSIPQSITYIGESAFNGCTGLTHIFIPNSITTIRNSTFRNCRQLESVTIPSSVKSIGEYAFYDCSGMASIKCLADIPPSVYSNSFSNFNVTLTVPRQCKSIYQMTNPWGYFYRIQEIPFDFEINGIYYAIIGTNTVEVTYKDDSHNNYQGNITIPSSVMYNGITYQIASIGDYAFMDCDQLSSISIPNTVTSIGISSFSGCRRLSGITIPNSIESIAESAFSDCIGLTDILIPMSVLSIGHNAFYGCMGLNYVVLMNSTPPSGSYDMFRKDQLIYAPNASIYKNTSYWNAYNIQSFYSAEPQITSATILSNNKNLFTLKQAKLMGSSGQVIKTFTPVGNNLIVTDMFPNSNNNISVTVGFGNEQIEIDDQIRTQELSFTQFSSTLSTQTTLKPTFSINRDESFILDACGVESGTEVYYGGIRETTNESYIIESIINGLTPNSSYSFRPWVQYKGVKYYGNYNTFSTASIEINDNVTVTPTSVLLTSDYTSPGDAEVTNAYITYNGERYETLYKTGLNPKTSYYYTYTIETTSGNQVTSHYFYTPSLSMEAQPVRMLTNTTVMFEAQTNMIDEETMVGFEWRRYDAPDEMPSTKVYSPVFGGKIAGTLKNLAENVYYKYRPFYTSDSGKSYFGNWVAFLTADAGVVYEPMVYTYNSPAVTQTEATLQGVALRGSDEITEQGFEYWKSGNNPIVKITASGERMSKKVSGLQQGTNYTFRAFVTSGGVTRYGNEVDFITLSNNLDVNLDGQVNITDINLIIDIILKGKSGSVGDTNGDGVVNIADINTIINAILKN